MKFTNRYLLERPLLSVMNTVLLRNVTAVRSVSGAIAQPDPLGTLLSLTDKTVVVGL